MIKQAFLTSWHEFSRGILCVYLQTRGVLKSFFFFLSLWGVHMCITLLAIEHPDSCQNAFTESSELLITFSMLCMTVPDIFMGHSLGLFHLNMVSSDSDRVLWATCRINV